MAYSTTPLLLYITAGVIIGLRWRAARSRW